MTAGAAGHPAVEPPRRLRFDRYVVDLDRGCLLRDGREIALRPKTFGILGCLVAGRGRLVSKDELFAAVWPNLAITDDVLVQSIGELRRAFGADGARLIRTVPRRGYRLESDVSVLDPADPPPGDPAPAATASPGPVAPGPAAGGGRPSAWFAGVPAGGRIAIVVALALAVVLVVAGVLFELTGLGGEGASTGLKPAIAVLPLVNQGDASRQYFADGLTEDIINALGRFSALTVMSWNAVLPYRGRPAGPAEIGRGLAVGYLVEGTVRQSGDRVRVEAQLVDTAGGAVLWSARFDEAMADVFALQDDITTQLVRALAVRVSQIEQGRALAKPTANLAAYDDVLRARPALQHPTRVGNVAARGLLKQAIERDPGYAAAYAGLARTYYIDTSMGWAESPAAALGHAEELAREALRLDASNVRAHIILARIDILHQNYAQARQETDLALAINPNDAQGLAGRGNVLMWLGETDAAIAALEQAERIDPDLAAMDRFALSLAYYLKGRYDAAIDQAELSLHDAAGADFGLVVMAAAYAGENRTEDAERTAAMIRRLDPASTRTPSARSS